MGYVVISEFVNTEDVTMNYIVKTDQNKHNLGPEQEITLYVSEERK